MRGNNKDTLIDWATARLGTPWTFQTCQDIDTIGGEVITAFNTRFTPEGLKVKIGMRMPWFPINLGERTLDAARFHRLRMRARATARGRILINTHSPDNSNVRLDPGVVVDTEWRAFDVDLRRATNWPKGKRGADGALLDRTGMITWGGGEQAVVKLYFYLDFPLDDGHDKGAVVDIGGVEILGSGIPDDEPPAITLLPSSADGLKFAIEDEAGVLASSLQIVVNGTLYTQASKTVTWDGRILSWKGGYAPERARVCVIAADREGNRGTMECECPVPAPKADVSAAAGFVRQSRSRTVCVSKGNSRAYEIDVGGCHSPINRAIEIRGDVENPKVVVDGGVNFENPQTVVDTLLTDEMTTKEKVRALWHFHMRSIYAMGMANPIDRSKYLNTCGYGFCGSQAPLQQALYEAAGIPWMTFHYVYPCGHMSSQAFYDGGWHMWDGIGRGYLLTNYGLDVASAEAIEGDPDIVEPRRGVVYGRFRELLRWPKMFLRPGKTKDNPALQFGSMNMRLRGDTTLLRTWQANGIWGHAPSEPLDYANGRLTFVPRLTLAGLRQEAEQAINIAASRGGGLGPRRSGTPAEVVYRVASPYLLVGGHVRIEGVTESRRHGLTASLSTDGGKTWEPVWKSFGKGRVAERIGLGRRMTRHILETDQPIHPDVHDVLVKVSLSQEGSGAGTALTGLEIATVTLPHAMRPDGRHTRLAQARIHVSDRPRMDLCAVVCDPVTPKAGSAVRLRAVVWNASSRQHVTDPHFTYVNGSPLKNVRVLFYNGNPRRNGELLGEKTIRHIEACEHGVAQLTWQLPERLQLVDVYVVAMHSTGPVLNHEKMTLHRRVECGGPKRRGAEVEFSMGHKSENVQANGG